MRYPTTQKVTFNTKPLGHLSASFLRNNGTRRSYRSSLSICILSVPTQCSIKGELYPYALVIVITFDQVAVFFYYNED